MALPGGSQQHLLSFARGHTRNQEGQGVFTAQLGLCHPASGPCRPENPKENGGSEGGLRFLQPPAASHLSGHVLEAQRHRQGVTNSRRGCHIQHRGCHTQLQSPSPRDRESWWMQEAALSG